MEEEPAGEEITEVSVRRTVSLGQQGREFLRLVVEMEE